MHDIGVRTLQVLEREYLSCLYIYIQRKEFLHKTSAQTLETDSLWNKSKKLKMHPTSVKSTFLLTSLTTTAGG
ncbi:hypothetical protein EB796_002158 [Bugula neritina]|uniref:Uncharacterized protein n=1 Tax=Bugula neritina TaxID=10212 RepID=A0A7J7KN18_BUGNE|nr:hypothetical protein EB796_002158 [Bugula neritina]